MYSGYSRRESQTSTGPPATDPLGSIHNLQLDIMDDIVQARKARMKLWNTSSEKVCEVQTVDENGAASTSQRYSNRRYSDFVGSTLAPIQSAASNRRASENPVISTPTASVAGSSKQAASTNFFKRTGIVVTNSDLMSIISSLASSATEINKCDDTSPAKSKPSTSNLLTPEPGMTRSNRSNSFDVSILHNAKQMVAGSKSSADKSAEALSGWFEKRHQPMSRKKSLRNTANVTVSFSKEVLDRFKDKEEKAKETKKPKSRLRWENRGALVDPHVIGNAIEGFLRKSTKSSRDSRYKRGSASTSSSKSSSSSFWFGKGDEDDSNDTCDSSFCSTLKDLFVK